MADLSAPISTISPLEQLFRGEHEKANLSLFQNTVDGFIIENDQIVGLLHSLGWPSMQ